MPPVGRRPGRQLDYRVFPASDAQRRAPALNPAEHKARNGDQQPLTLKAPGERHQVLGKGPTAVQRQIIPVEKKIRISPSKSEQKRSQGYFYPAILPAFHESAQIRRRFASNGFKLLLEHIEVDRPAV